MNALQRVHFLLLTVALVVSGTPIHLPEQISFGAVTVAAASTIPSPENTTTTEFLRRDTPVDNNDISNALDIINTALLNLAYIPPVPYGKVLCRATDPSHHELARLDAVFRKGIPNLAAGKRNTCDAAPATGKCEPLWCGSNSGIYLCPRKNENKIEFSCAEAALYAFAASVECRAGKGVTGMAW
ncbi:hypothetical protein QBC39DRAFT_356538, partial [Podospora conica]